MMDINWLAVGLAALATFMLGGLWYSPALFTKAWMRETGLSEEAARAGNPAIVFGGSFVLSLISAAVFAVFLGPDPGLGFAVGAGLAAGLGWVATSFGINYLFERKSLALFLINGGFHTVQFALFGLILGLWH
ncbi:MAG: DUF1761 domain-containing protein [Bauldia sp.]|nr:DUF1761 domain-containing protein [Bauldia sp.]